MKIFFAVVVIVLLFVIGATLYVYKKKVPCFCRHFLASADFQK